MANQQQDGSVLEAEKTQVKPPPLYKVMLQVHRDGMGVCGTYVREVAAAKVDQVIDLARQHQHPLQCTMEET